MATKKKPAKKGAAKAAPSKDAALLKALTTYTDGVTDHRGKVIEGDEAVAHEIVVKAGELATLLQNHIANTTEGDNE